MNGHETLERKSTNWKDMKLELYFFPSVQMTSKWTEDIMKSQM